MIQTGVARWLLSSPHGHGCELIGTLTRGDHRPPAFTPF
ncbi:hypothetical protein EV13_1624 [Prochlorococcus sp. MIT 0702]|nr:hypothetical protein EV13_1624 [Prochlorococcus sp. MIT 0702]KGG28688.1 hypothetical protein EV12_0583 [Prochlorococcus sp. MIT 0701]KGG36332.1 hypothetical protein EV14_0426 [Prochlorococcus sp. MIT 0703]